MAETGAAACTGERVKCRSCGGGSFGDVIDLGLMPLVNNLLPHPDAPCARWPLKVVFCRGCALAQLTETPPPSEMFEEYLYFSSQSHTMVAHARKLVDRYVAPEERVMEIASNDGYLLREAQARGATVLGIDPARNIAAYANGLGIPTLCDYFNRRSAENIVSDWGRADVIFANNVLAHVPDPNEIAAGIAMLLSKGGVAHIEVPYLVRMIESRAFDTMYHEHQSYFSMCALAALLNRHGLQIINGEEISIHGGSLHVEIAHAGNQDRAHDMMERERERGVHTDAFYGDFARRVWELRDQLCRRMSEFNRVVGYGAAAKGVVLLNTFNFGIDRIAWVADVSPHKQGKFIPGTRQPIVSPQKLLEEMPDAALLLPWNIQDEVVRRNEEYLNQGGCFIVPIPEVRIIRAPHS